MSTQHQHGHEHSDEHMNHDHEHHNHQEHSSHQGHDHHGHGGMDHSMHMGNLKVKFIVSLVLSIPILLMAPMMGVELPFQFTFQGSEWIVTLLATILFFYGGLPFLQGAKMELGNKNPAMMTLISLGITVAYVYSMYAFVMNTFFQPDMHIMDFFWELATLIVIMLLGHWIEMNAIQNAGNALQKMAELLPGSATVVDENGETKEVPLQEVEEGQQVRVKAGGKIPTDGVIRSGKTSVDEAMVTGESKQIEKGEGEKVIGGSVNGSGTVTIEVTATGESGYLSQVMELVSNAQNEKSRAETVSDKVAKWLFYIALGVGILAFIIWMSLEGDINVALERMVTVLIIACPHALGLAIPLVTARTTSLGAQNGLLIKDRQALETSRHADIVMMDKTGTLTEGNFAVNEYTSFSDQYTDEEVLQMLGALEEHSSHPLAVGILDKIRELELSTPDASDVDTIAGVGLEGTVNNQKLKIVSVSYLDKNDISYDEEQFKQLSSKGNSVSFLLVDEENIGLIAQGDQIKPEAYDLIKELKEKSIQPVMLTGDNKQVAQAVARQLGIEDIHAQLMPEDKEKIIREYKDDGHVVMMVGDGVNDAPSLVRADVGIAIGAGTDVAIDSADTILVKSNPSDIRHFLTLAKNNSRKMVQNLWWGAGYNIIAIPLAAGVLAPWNILLTPAMGAVVMSLSTIIVAINAMLLKLD